MEKVSLSRPAPAERPLVLWACTYVSPLLPESSALSNTSVPHIIPVLSLLERGMALGETLEPWESAEVGVDVVMFHLEAARTMAHHGGLYRTNAEGKLQGEGPSAGLSSGVWCPVSASPVS